MKSFSAFLNENLTDEEFYLIEKSDKKVGEMSPAQLAKHGEATEAAKQWHKDNPINHQNIVDHFNEATTGERTHGESWYSDAHHMTKMIAHDTKTPMHTMAGIVSTYSPQTHWAVNMLTASKVARTKKALGGPGDGVFADEKQKNFAHRILNGEHYDNVLVGQKTRAFAHLIEHGGSKDPANPRVCVDRHAYSVAAGARLTDDAFGAAGLKGKKKYNQVSDAYVKAANQLSEQHGCKIEPHQVQAVTWLVRQRKNAEQETTSAGSSKTSKVAAAHTKKWNDYAGEHHPSIIGREPGTGYASSLKD